ncbi:hypothetical protein ABW21_db0209207 [Orbilia brochopaga]|nr:hypothetical protein ABW21_db0209207 [Drechslerella brochopaga]
MAYGNRLLSSAVSWQPNLQRRLNIFATRYILGHDAAFSNSLFSRTSPHPFNAKSYSCSLGQHYADVLSAASYDIIARLVTNLSRTRGGKFSNHAVLQVIQFCSTDLMHWPDLPASDILTSIKNSYEVNYTIVRESSTFKDLIRRLTPNARSKELMIFFFLCLNNRRHGAAKWRLWDQSCSGINSYRFYLIQ